MTDSLGIAARLAGGILAALLPADCFLCLQPLQWHQRGSVCPPCWGGLPWSPGLRLAPGPLRAVVWAADYEGPVRRLVRGFKFEGMDYLGGPLGREAATRIAPLLWPAALPRVDLVVPVPLHWWRSYHRGYNQASLLARPLARQIEVPLATGLLQRRRPGRRQLGLARADRLRALQGCFRVRGGAGTRRRHRILAGRTVLVVDDVVTTGATLDACARALLGAGARAVVAVVLARTVLHDRRARAESELRG